MRNLKRKTYGRKREDGFCASQVTLSCCSFRDHKELLSSHNPTSRKFTGTVQDHQSQSGHHGPVVWKV